MSCYCNCWIRNNGGMQIKIPISRITQKEIAKLAGVSQSTVSIVLGNLPMIARIPESTRRKILKISASTNYRTNPVARQLRLGKKSEIIAVIVSAVFSYYLQDLILAIERILSSRGYDIIILRLDTDDASLEMKLKNMLRHDYHGIICLEHFSKHGASLIPKVLKQYDNTVYLEKPEGVKTDKYVSINYASGVVEAIKALSERGRNRIALCLNDMVYPSMKGRFSGYKNGLKKCGISFDPSLCWFAADYNLSGWDSFPLEEIISRIYDDIIRRQNANAVIASNDEWAVALVKILRKKGSNIPREISVVGYGDFHSLCWACEPELSTISHGNLEIAANICRIVLNGGKSKLIAPVTIESHFVSRESS